MPPDFVATATDRHRILYPAAALLLMTAGFILTKTGRDALYFQRDGLFDLPWAYLGIAVLSVPMALITLSLLQSRGPRPVRVILPVATAVLQLFFYAFAEPGGGPVMTAFFMSIPLLYGVMFSTTWLFGSELVEAFPKDRLAVAYAKLGAASMAGGLMGAGAAKCLAPYLQAADFILAGAAGVVASVLVVVRGHRLFPWRQPPAVDGHRATFGGGGIMPPFAEMFSTLQLGYVRSLLLVAALASMAGVLIEFQFYLLAASAGGGGRENVDFFANFYIFLTAAGLLLQLLAMPALQRRVGVRGSLMVLPLSLLGGAVMLAISASGLGRAALRVAEGGLKSSIHRANWEQAYLPIVRPQRLIAKVLVDGMGARMAEGAAAGLLLAWLHVYVADRDLARLDVAWIPYWIAGSAVLWAGVTAAMGGRATARVGDEDPGDDVPLPDCCPVTRCLGETAQQESV